MNAETLKYLIDEAYNQAIEDAAKHVDLSLPPINGDSIRKLKRSVCGQVSNILSRIIIEDLQLIHAYKLMSDEEVFCLMLGDKVTLHLNREQALTLKLWLEERLK